MSSFALLRVSARTDLPDIAAVGIIFLKLAGSSDTMQTVERTEEPLRMRGLMYQQQQREGAWLQLHREQSWVSLLRAEENKEAASSVDVVPRVHSTKYKYYTTITVSHWWCCWGTSTRVLCRWRTHSSVVFGGKWQSLHWLIVSCTNKLKKQVIFVQ